VGIDFRPIAIGDPGVSRVHRDTFMKIIGNRVKTIMEYNGIYINELADLAASHRQTIMRYRNARQMPTVFLVANVAAALGVRFSDLIPDHIYVNDRLEEQNVTEAWLDYEKELFELSVEPRAFDYMNPYQYQTVDEWSARFLDRFVSILNDQDYVINGLEFASTIGQHYSTIYYILERKRLPSLPTFVNICMGLGVSVDEMIGLDDFLWV
jgi:transcriptional regulator with XRE-family HTH domain